MEAAWRRDLLARLSSSSLGDKIKIILVESFDEEVLASRFTFMSSLLGGFAEGAQLEPLVKALVPLIRSEFNYPEAYSIIGGLIAKRTSISLVEVGSLMYLCNACPEIIPYLLAEMNGRLEIPLVLQLVGEILKANWYVDPRDMVEFISGLPSDVVPEMQAELLIQCLRKTSCVSTAGLIIAKQKVLTVPGDHAEKRFLLCLDALLNFCKENGEFFLTKVLDLFDFVPAVLKDIFASFLSVVLLMENSSASLIKQISGKCGSSALLNVALFYLRFDRPAIPTIENNSRTALDPSYEFMVKSEEPQFFISYWNNSNLLLMDSLTEEIFLQKLTLIDLTQLILTGPCDLTRRLNLLCELCSSDEHLNELLVWCLKTYPGAIDEIIEFILAYGGKDEYRQAFAMSIFTSLLPCSKLSLRLLVILCKNLSKEASFSYTFKIIQSALIELLPHNPVAFAVCVKYLSEAESRQSYLNFCFGCVKEFFRQVSINVVAPEALGLVLESLIQLSFIRYIDPKIVWKSFVEGHGLTKIKDVPYLTGLCAVLASISISSEKLCILMSFCTHRSDPLAIDEPIPEHIMTHFTFIKDGLLGSRDRVQVELCAKAIGTLDPLYFGEQYPAAQVLLHHLIRFEYPIKESDAFCALLKGRMDREIMDMPRSLFLGSGSVGKVKSASSDSDLTAILTGLVKKVRSEWKSAPYLLESHLVLYSADDQPGDTAFLELKEGFPPIMQLHWSTRLGIMSLLETFTTSCLKALNELGKMSQFVRRLDAELDMNTPWSSPSEISSRVLLKTAVEISRYKIIGGDTERLGSLFHKLQSLDVRGVEEAQSAKVLALTPLARLLGEGMISVLPQADGASAWMSMLKEHVESSFGCGPEKIPMREAETYKLKTLVEANQLSSDDVKSVQLILSTAENISLDALDLFMKLHQKMILSEPADIKSYFSASLSRSLASSGADDAINVWIKHLIGKIDKPGPALIKMDATITLVELIRASNGAVELPKAFVGVILPTLTSSTSDVRINTWYILLLATALTCGAIESTGSGADASERFGDLAFGSLLHELHSRNDLRRSNIITLLASLKLLPVVDWTGLVSSPEFIHRHVVSHLGNGGHTVSPSLLAMVKQARSCGALPLMCLPYLEASDQEYILREKILCDGVTAEALNGLAELVKAGSISVTAYTERILTLLPDPFGEVKAYHGLYLAASGLIDMSSKGPKVDLARLIASQEEQSAVRLVIEMFKEDAKELMSSGYLDAILLEASGKISERKPRVDLMGKILDLALLLPDIGDVLHRSLSLLVLLWTSSCRGALLIPSALHPYYVDRTDILLGEDIDPAIVQRVWEGFKARYLEEAEDWRRICLRLAKLPWNLV